MTRYNHNTIVTYRNFSAIINQLAKVEAAKAPTKAPEQRPGTRYSMYALQGHMSRAIDRLWAAGRADSPACKALLEADFANILYAEPIPASIGKLALAWGRPNGVTKLMANTMLSLGAGWKCQG